MTFFHAIILAIVEGLTEFLPISSTGHMILASSWLKIPQIDFVKSFEIFIQLGAILAVVGLYGQKLLTNTKLWLPLLAGFVPTAIVGLVGYSFIKHNLIGTTAVVLWSLALGGLVLLVIDKLVPGKQKSVTALTWKDAAVIGSFQAISVIPGVSRAAATIIGGLLVGLDRQAAVEFSFLLAVPTLAAASGLDLLKSGWSFTSGEWALLIVGLVVSTITAWLAIKFFLGFVKKHNFQVFGIYRILLVIIFFLLTRFGFS